MQRRHLALVGALVAVSLLGVFLWGRADERSVTIKLLLPEAAGEANVLKTVWVDGVPVSKLTPDTGVERTIKTTPPPAGKDHAVVKILWEPNNYTKIVRKRKVVFKAGEEAVADLRKEDPKDRDEIKVRFVPTPQVVVDKMCEMAKVGKNDVVYDLGCGDGIIVVTAVKKYGAKRGAGVDIDPERIEDSVRTAKEHGVSNKVEFWQGDVLKPIKGLSEASVVMLYMGDDIGRRLAPVLQEQLKPGSRVVSHRFTLGDWKPKRTETVTDGGSEIQVHLWIVGEDGKKQKE